MAKEPNLFEEALDGYDAFVSVSPVNNPNLFILTSQLETTGLQQVGSGELTAQKFAEAMHGVFSKIADLEIDPPLDEMHVKQVAGKVATYGAMREATVPKKRSRRGKTDPADIPTDEKK